MSSFKTIILTTIVLLTTLSVFASKYPSPNDGVYHYVHDYAGVLDEPQKSSLESFSADMEDSLYVQVATVLMDSISYDDDIDDYATELFTEWGIGSKKTDGGVLILCVMNSHDVVIRTGYGVEGALTDAACITIINKKIAPNFREGDYYRGLLEALASISGIVRGEFTAEDMASDDDEEDVNWAVIGIILFVIFVLPLFLPKRYRSTYYAFLFDILISVLLSGGKGGGGGGGRSFGGGSTGGGGARGKW